MTERERAARALGEAETEMQRAVSAQLRDEGGARERLARAKVRMHHATSRAYRALGVPVPSTESALPDYGAGRAGAGGDAGRRKTKGRPMKSGPQ